MRIKVDTVWGKIEDADSGREIVSFFRNNYAFHSVLTSALNNTQMRNCIESDGTFTLSKKREKAMFQEIERQKKLYKLN